MGDPQEPKPSQTQNPNLPQSSSSKISGEIGSGSGSGAGSGGNKYPNPRETVNPDAATLREQWRFAIRQYSKWYSHAWGTAILAGVSFFALGWIIKGSNPLPSFQSDDEKNTTNTTKTNAAAAAADADAEVHQAR